MNLSNELISQFVRITNDNKKTKSESTVYGTIVEYDDTMYVKLDGSELLTPITTTTDIAVEERVTVLIKDHSATVTGNISSPSARTDTVKEVRNNLETLGNQVTVFEEVVSNKVNAEQLNATNANITTLFADVATLKEVTVNGAEVQELKAENVEIRETLTAQSASIESLQTNKLDATVANAKFATIENLNATNANVTRLDVDKLDADTAEITYATIASLQATNANVTNLAADVAGIDTLIYGSATGTSIHSSFANAVIAQLSNAQIKSAMIDSVSASKINTGNISTNNVNVTSDDGKLLISDETIQISDNTRVRVQIGKDANNDYSINIWDANGNLMFSEGGITDKAIKNAIIRNDMVSDTANIAAHKLDIDSLFEEINGSTKTIKSSKVYFDDSKQTLDVAFESVTTDIEELQNGVSSQGTAISVMQGQIASKVWKSDIDTAVNEVGTITENLSTQYEEMQQDLEGLSATVSSHTSTLQNKADNSALTTVSNKVTSLETDISGFKTSVSNTYATKTDVDNQITSTEAKITQNANSITSLVARTEVVENKFTGYSTTEQMNSAITQSKNSITSSVSQTYTTKTEFNNLEIGGRNLIANTDETREYVGNASGVTSGYKDVWSGKTISIPTGTEYVVSFDAKADVPQTIRCHFYSPNTTLTALSSTGQSKENAVDGSIDVSITSEWARYWVKWTQTPADAVKNVIVGRNTTENDIYIRKVKLEAGNKATDWTPAPEDMATVDSVESVQSSVTLTEERVITTETLIEQLSDSISMLVTDGNGQSLMTQTESGWTFSTAEIQDIVDATSESLDNLTNEVGDIDSAVGILQQAMDDIGVLTDYVKITTHENEPCIELGEVDSDFKLLITNTRIMFMEGSGVPAYINNQSLHIKTAVIEEEMQQGEFVWKIRSNGNLGLVWKGGN